MNHVDWNPAPLLDSSLPRTSIRSCDQETRDVLTGVKRKGAEILEKWSKDEKL